MGNSATDTMHEGTTDFGTVEISVSINQPEFRATDAEPGSREKLAILAHRIRLGLPLWHPDDRHAEDGPLSQTG